MGSIATPYDAPQGLHTLPAEVPGVNQGDAELILDGVMMCSTDGSRGCVGAGTGQ